MDDGILDEASTHAGSEFNEAINRRDLDALGELMTDDHTFIDSAGNVLAGKEESLGAWRGSTQPALDGPAIWTARAADDKFSEWCVYEDTPATRLQLGIGKGE